jgi:hypothetical protein
MEYVLRLQEALDHLAAKPATDQLNIFASSLDVLPNSESLRL